MKNVLPFEKMNGCGNDFVVIDRPLTAVTVDTVSWVQAVCALRTGVGADGVLAVTESDSADMRMAIYNADGSEAEMCGNGLRCAVLYAWERNLIGNTATVETLAGVLPVSISDTGEVSVEMVTDERPVEHELLEQNISVIDTGVPHAVCFVEDLENYDVCYNGRLIRTHENFAPNGVNVNFVKVVEGENGPSLLVRTYERGVEGETLACGTGATAAAVIAHLREYVGPSVNVHVKGGKMRITVERTPSGSIQKVVMCGGAQFVYRGELYV